MTKIRAFLAGSFAVILVLVLLGFMGRAMGFNVPIISNIFNRLGI
jgi:hypothetical protein